MEQGALRQRKDRNSLFFGVPVCQENNPDLQNNWKRKERKKEKKGKEFCDSSFSRIRKGALGNPFRRKRRFLSSLYNSRGESSPNEILPRA